MIVRALEETAAKLPFVTIALLHIEPPARLIGSVPSHDPAVELQDLCLQHPQLGAKAALLRMVGALTAPTYMALASRWRSRPQHQKQTSENSSAVNWPHREKSTKSSYERVGREH